MLAILLAQGAQALEVGVRIAQVIAVTVRREALRRMVEHLGHVGHEVRERQIDGMLRVRQRRPRHSGHGGGQIVINLDGRAVHLTLDADHADIRAAGLLRIPLRPLKAGAGQFEDVAQADLFIRLIEQRIAGRHRVILRGGRRQQLVAIPRAAVRARVQVARANVGRKQIDIASVLF